LFYFQLAEREDWQHDNFIWWSINRSNTERLVGFARRLRSRLTFPHCKRMQQLLFLSSVDALRPVFLYVCRRAVHAYITRRAYVYIERADASRRD
jgi:hypothetical protein